MNTYFRVCFSLLLVCFVMNLHANNYDIEKLRTDYIKAVDSSEKLDSLMAYLGKFDANDPLILAYRGACEALKAKHAWNPFDKLGYLKKFDATMKKAVAADSQNIEIRFLRFSVQHYLPDFLGYSKHLSEDLAAISQNIGSEQNQKLGKKTVQVIAKFALDSKRCSPQQKIILEKWF